MTLGKATIEDSDTQQFLQLAERNPSHSFKLSLVQQPSTGKAVSTVLRARGMRWPIEPPPVLELISNEKEPQKWLYIHNPNWFCVADIITIEVKDKGKRGQSEAQKEAENKEGSKDNLSGLLASSLHKVKSPEDRNEHGYFVFGDLNLRDAGKYKLEFTLFEMRRFENQVYAAKVDSIISDEFQVLGTKSTPTTSNSTKLSKTLSESGVKIRLRKESTKRAKPGFNWSATTNENFNYDTNTRVHPTNLAPMINAGPMGPPPTSNNSRMSRNVGEDISRRTSVVQNNFGGHGVQPQMTSPVDSYHSNSSQGYLLGHTTSMGPRSPDFPYYNTLSPHTKMPATLPPGQALGQVPFNQMQQAPSQQGWANWLPGSEFRPEAGNEHLSYMASGQHLPDPRMAHPRIDSGYSSHGRNSHSMESGMAEQQMVARPAHGQTSMPGIQQQQNEAMHPAAWGMHQPTPPYTTYESMHPINAHDVSSSNNGMQGGFIYQRGLNPGYEALQQQTSQP